MLTALYIIGGLLLLFAGGELLIRGAVSLAKEIGISPFVIGLTVVAYGTSSPELMISIESILEGHPDIALGNVIGSNISNILCVMGLSACIYPIMIDKKIGASEGYMVLAVTICLAILLLTVDNFGPVIGLSFVSILCGYTIFIFWQARKKIDLLPLEQVHEVEEQMKWELTWWQAVLISIIGVGLLVAGANLLVSGTVIISRYFGVSEAAISVTLVAFGGSVPELVTSVVAAVHKKSEIVLGNILGSNLFNILGILGITSLVKPIEVSEKFALDAYIVMLVTLILTLTILWRNRISRSLGAVWFASYLFYVYAQFV